MLAILLQHKLIGEICDCLIVLSIVMGKTWFMIKVDIGVCMRLLIVCTVIVLLACLSSCGAPRQIEDAYDNGQAKTIGQTQSRKQVGVWSYFYDDGSLKARGPWKKDYQDGEWT